MQHRQGFYPADLSPAWTRFWWRINQWFLLPRLGIHVEVAEADLARLRALPTSASIIVASNHPSFADPMVLFELLRRWGRMGYFVAARVLFQRLGGLQGKLIQKVGAFSVSPGANNEEAVRYARERLRDGGHPVVIFPEGHTFYLNDVILPLKPGVAEWALEMADAERPSLVVPVAIKYHYLRDIRDSLNRGLDAMERRVLPNAPEVPPGDFWSRLYVRLYRVGDVVLTRQEENYGYHPPRGSDIDERVAGLSEYLIQDLERTHLQGPPHGSLFDRARHLMAMLEEDTNAEHATDAQEARFAWALSTFHAGYLQPDSSPERFAETVMKYTRELFDRVPLGLPLQRRASIRIGDILDARQYRDRSTEAGRTHLLHDLSASLQTMVDSLQENLPQVFE